jgi:CPA1 family monovalent cation:H+ antiporter
MTVVALILILLGAAAALQLAAQRLHVPPPVLLVIGGLLLAVTPGLPRARLDPDIVFLLFVPPLLYRAALTTSWRDFRAHLRSILLLAVGLVLATILATAAVAHRIVPGLSWPSALLLGVIISPPDPVAATAVLRNLDAPRDIATVLEGEGLVNDATAFVGYRMGVDAVESGRFSPGEATVRFLVAAAGGIGVGLLAGVLIASLRRHVAHAPEVENTVSLLTPFVAFIPADRLGLSGVLAVVAVGLYLGREGPRIVSPDTRMQAANMWDVMTFVLEGLIFILIGLDLPLVTQDLAGSSVASLTLYGVVISATAMAVRMLWIFPAAYLPRRFDEWRGRETHYPSWRGVFFAGWAGIRGADSLVIALALPLTTTAGRPFPGRSPIIYVTFVVILVTLVFQGLTLAPLVRWLAQHTDGEDVEQDEETLARLRIAKAGLARLDELIAQDPRHADAARRLRTHHAHRVHRYEHRRRHTRHERDEAEAQAARAARAEMLQAERRELVRLRDDGTISDDVMRRVQHELDLEQMLIGTGDEPLARESS